MGRSRRARINRWKLGQTSLEERIVANRWTLVKLHFDTSRTSAQYEAWLTPLGGKTVKVAESDRRSDAGVLLEDARGQGGGAQGFPDADNPGGPFGLGRSGEKQQGLLDLHGRFCDGGSGGSAAEVR